MQQLFQQQQQQQQGPAAVSSNSLLEHVKAILVLQEGEPYFLSLQSFLTTMHNFQGLGCLGHIRFGGAEGRAGQCNMAELG
eukprot:1160669-Pelagomonas_calceolata.AAC.11